MLTVNLRAHYLQLKCSLWGWGTDYNLLMHMTEHLLHVLSYLNYSSTCSKHLTCH